MIKKVLSFFIVRKRMMSFRKNSVFGGGLQLDIHSLCINDTGRQNAIQIGTGCCIRGKLFAKGNGNIRVGNNCYIGGNSVLGSKNSITLGNEVIIAGDTYIYDNNNHPVEPELREEMCKSNDYFGPLWSWDKAVSAPVVIDDNVWIGERCAILKGVHIGKGSVIGCSSVVTKDIPPYCVAAGNPARVVKRLEPRKRDSEK